MKIEQFINASSSIGIYGAGKIGQCVYKYVKKQHKYVILIDGYKKNKFYEPKIYKIDEINSNIDVIFVTISNEAIALKVKDKLLQKYKNVYIINKYEYGYYFSMCYSFFDKIISFFTCNTE